MHIIWLGLWALQSGLWKDKLYMMCFILWLLAKKYSKVAEQPVAYGFETRLD